MIRDATLADVPALVELGRQMHAESPVFNRLRYWPEKVGKQIASLIEADYGFARVAERNGVLVAGMIGFVLPEWCSYDLVAHEMALFTSADARGGVLGAALIKQFKAWSLDQGAVYGTLGVSTGVCVEQTGRLYQSQGARRIGDIYEFTKD